MVGGWGTRSAKGYASVEIASCDSGSLLKRSYHCSHEHGYDLSNKVPQSQEVYPRLLRMHHPHDHGSDFFNKLPQFQDTISTESESFGIGCRPPKQGYGSGPRWQTDSVRLRCLVTNASVYCITHRCDTNPAVNCITELA